MEDIEQSIPVESHFDADPASPFGTIFVGLVAVAGLLIGGWGLFSANAAKKEIALLKEQMGSGPDDSAYQEQLNGISTRLDSLELEPDRLNRKIRTDFQQAVNSIDQRIGTNRTLVNGNSDAIREIQNHLTTGMATNTTGTPPTPPPADTGDERVSLDNGTTPPAPAGDTYQVVEGDTGMGIARKNGTTIGALEAINPGINWNRLQIGQQIKLPE